MISRASSNDSSLLSSIATIGTFAAVKSLLGPTSAQERAKPGGDRETSEREPLAIDHARAREPGRGRDATRPTDIPWPGWMDILWRTAKQIQEDRLLAIAAGVVFYALLALFPAVTALISLYGLFASVDTVRQHLEFAQSLLPAGAVQIIDEQVARLIAKGEVKLGLGFAVGLGLALWSANAGMKAIIDGLNIMYGETEKRGFFKLNLVALAFTVGAIAALLLSISAIVVAPLVLDGIGLGFLARTLIEWLRWPLLLAILLVGFALLYRYGPSRADAQWRWLSIGSVAATLTWLAASALFSYYLKHYANYDATYGSLGTAIGLMMWLWMSIIVTLAGAELNAEIEHQTARDTTEDGPKPLGARGAAMADAVGQAQ